MHRAAALLLAGSLFSFLGLGRVRGGVVIEGVEVGGMRYAEAERVIRAHISPLPLVIRTPAGDFDLTSSIEETDNAALLVRRARRGEKLSLTRTRRLTDMEELLLGVCRGNAREAQEAKLSFSADGFVYSPEREGICCDYARLVGEVSRALEEGRESVSLVCRSYAPSVTEETLRARTRTLSFQKTYFDGTNAPRRHNIALAASRIGGRVIAPHETFSFNEAVGERTEENGFLVASVILGGQFVPGVGGGVCQASTTLYLAALRAGLTVTEASPHSLSVGYVPPSLDAMVSEASDLKFTNPYDEPVYLLAEMGEGSVGFRVCGLPDGRRYEVESLVTGRILPPPPEETEGEEDAVLRYEREGIESESYLLVYDGEGRLLSRKRLRKDRYAPVRGKRTVKKSAPDPENSEKEEKISQDTGKND